MHNLYRILWLALVLCLGMGMVSQGVAQERGELEEAEIARFLREQQLDVERMETELHHESQMRELDIEARRLEMDLMRGESRDHDDGAAAVFLIVCLAANILMALWVYSDNRSRDAGQGIWIVITLLVGFFGALVYAVIRLGDVSKPAPRSTAPRK